MKKMTETPEFKLPAEGVRLVPSKRPPKMEDAVLCWKATMGCMALWGFSTGAKAAVNWDGHTTAFGKLLYSTENQCWAVKLNTTDATRYDMHYLYDLMGEEL
jgi:hypothetical protein